MADSNYLNEIKRRRTFAIILVPLKEENQVSMRRLTGWKWKKKEGSR